VGLINFNFHQVKSQRRVRVVQVILVVAQRV